MVREMFVGLTGQERSGFLSQTAEALVPGYTGHCPTLKFRVGKRYGANTKDIQEERGQQGMMKRHEPYRPPLKESNFNVLHRPLSGTSRAQEPAKIVADKNRRYILGYTGYIPGLNFRYGTSFLRAADDSLGEFCRRVADQEARRETERAQRASSAPKMVSIRSRDEVKSAIKQFNDENSIRKFKAKTLTDFPPLAGYTGHFPPIRKESPPTKYERKVSSDFPPIAGYTGHIPRLRGADTTLSQRYNLVARRGLEMMHNEREQRQKLKSASHRIGDELRAARNPYSM